jgi:hypothetical protein
MTRTLDVDPARRLRAVVAGRVQGRLRDLVPGLIRALARVPETAADRTGGRGHLRARLLDVLAVADDNLVRDPGHADTTGAADPTPVLDLPRGLIRHDRPRGVRVDHARRGQRVDRPSRWRKC